MKHNLLAGRQWLYQYDLLRVILVALVVIGHGAFMTIRTPFGSAKYGLKLVEAGLSDSTFHRAISFLANWVYSFHMPVFIALSGTLYNIQKKEGAYPDFRSFVAGKAKRLLIPLFVVWWVYRFPIMYFTGFYEGSSAGAILLQMFAPNCVYLWYLEALFLIFVLIYGLDTIQNKKVEMVVVAGLYLIGLVLYRKFSAYHFFGDPLYYLIWFYIGMYAEGIIGWLEEKGILTSGTAILLLLIQTGLFILNRRLSLNKFISVGVSYIVLPFLMLVLIYYIVNHYHIKDTERIHKISSYCMGIYLYAEPLNYMLLYLFCTWFDIGVFASEVGSAALWLLRVFMTPLVAIGITWVLKKTKLKYLY